MPIGVIRKQSKPLWKQMLSQSITTAKGLSALFDIDESKLHRVIARYPVRINPYYLSLIKHKDDAIYKQCIPDIREIIDEKGIEDPLNEETLSPVQGLTHRYPDRVLFLVSAHCAAYCRFCNRKRKVGHSRMVSKKSIKEGLAYIKSNRKIRDVLLSGGDPLLLDNQDLFMILTQLRSMSHVEIIRIGTRVPCTLPHRITSQLSKMLKKFHPLYIHTHFNHPDEITPYASLACKRLSDAGIPLGCQTVLLKGVNDAPLVLKRLMRKLLTIRVRPYYLFQADLAKGTAHFRTPITKGLETISALQGHTSGLCVPHYAIDLPGGGGKVPLLPEYIVEEDEDNMFLMNYLGKKYAYPCRNRIDD